MSDDGTTTRLEGVPKGNPSDPLLLAFIALESDSGCAVAVAARILSPHTCPCCRAPTLTGEQYEICHVCNWEDDGQGDHNAAEFTSGPNGMSLIEARVRWGLRLAKWGHRL